MLTYSEQLRKVFDMFIELEWNVKFFEVHNGGDNSINVFGSCYTKEFTSSQDFFIEVSKYGYISMT